MSENEGLRRIFGHKRKEVRRGSEEFHDLHSSPNRVIKSRRTI
jgi:hypothetical protein